MLPELTPQEARQRQQDGAVIIDVREAYEWDAGHIPGAEHRPMMALAQALDELPTDQDVIFQCHVGGRSAQMTLYALHKGHTRVWNLAGGIERWAAEGLPVIEG